jgi:hypothetical protein
MNWGGGRPCPDAVVRGIGAFWVYSVTSKDSVLSFCFSFVPGRKTKNVVLKGGESGQSKERYPLRLLESVQCTSPMLLRKP